MWLISFECDAFRFPCSHPGFDPPSEKLWQPFVQGRLYFPEKSRDFSGWYRTRSAPLPAWGCSLWPVCISPLPPHLWVSECGFGKMERARVKECEGGKERLSKDAELSGPLSSAPCQTVNQNKWYFDCAILAPSLLVFLPPEGGSNWRSIVFCPL